MGNFAEIRTLFFQFMKFGCFTFGGGWGIVAQMRERYVLQEQSLSNEALLDLTSIGRSLPGVMIGNIAMLYGFRRAGYLGGAACLIGMALPPAIVLTFITLFYSAIQGNPWAGAAMRGVRVAVVPIILSALLGILRGAFRYPPCLAVALGTFVLYIFGKVNCVWLVILGAILGLVICEIYERRGVHDPD